MGEGSYITLFSPSDVTAFHRGFIRSGAVVAQGSNVGGGGEGGGGLLTEYVLGSYVL